MGLTTSTQVPLQVFKNEIKARILDSKHLVKYFDVNLILQDLDICNNAKQADVLWAIIVFGLWMEKNV